MKCPLLAPSNSPAIQPGSGDPACSAQRAGPPASESAAAQQAITDLTREFREAQRKLQEIDRQLAQRTARLRLLQQLAEKWEGFGEGAKAVLQGRLDAALNGAKVTPIMHGLAVKQEFGKSFPGVPDNDWGDPNGLDANSGCVK